MRVVVVRVRMGQLGVQRERGAVQRPGGPAQRQRRAARAQHQPQRRQSRALLAHVAVRLLGAVLGVRLLVQRNVQI